MNSDAGDMGIPICRCIADVRYKVFLQM